MTTSIRKQGQGILPSCKTLRLTFRVTSGEIRLVSFARLEMICPGSVGECPKVGRNGGYWMELRDTDGHVLFHRLLHAPLGNSVEVHSADGKIQRVFGAPTDTIFEVLVPDQPDAVSIVLMGENLDATTGFAKAAGSSELAHFDIPKRDIAAEGLVHGCK